MESPPHKATQACGPFKKRKRKCDKLLPKCSLCVRISRACHYTDAPKPTPTAAEFAALQERLTELEDRLSRSSEHPGSLSAAVSVSGASSLATESSGTTWPSRGLASFPSALFLDIDCYKWSNMQLPRPAVSIPMVGSIFTSLTFPFSFCSFILDTVADKHLGSTRRPQPAKRNT